MFQTGYILCRRDDLIWFLTLPFIAVGIALIMQHWLPAVALVSITLFITAPHHFVTWLRTYGITEEWQRWKTRLIFGPIVLILLVVAGVKWAPVTLALIAILWTISTALCSNMDSPEFTTSRPKQAARLLLGLICGSVGRCI